MPGFAHKARTRDDETGLTQTGCKTADQYLYILENEESHLKLDLVLNLVPRKYTLRHRLEGQLQDLPNTRLRPTLILHLTPTASTQAKKR